MQPEAVAEFVRAFSAEVSARRGAETAARSLQEAERAAPMRKLDGLYDAIAEGVRPPGLKQELEAMEARMAALDEALAAPAPAPVRLHPNPSELHRRKVTALATTAAAPEIRTPALETVCGLIECVTVQLDEAGEVTLARDGALVAMQDLAQPGAVRHLSCSSVSVVAGTRNRRSLPRPRCPLPARTKRQGAWPLIAFLRDVVRTHGPRPGAGTTGTPRGSLATVL